MIKTPPQMKLCEQLENHQMKSQMHWSIDVSQPVLFLLPGYLCTMGLASLPFPLSFL